MDFKFSGINIISDNPPETFEFYKKLGLRVTAECAPDDKWYGATFALSNDANEPQIWIWRRHENDPKTKNMFVFDTDDKLDETYERIKQSGIECQPPIVAEWGGRELTVTDPDGNMILFL